MVLIIPPKEESVLIIEFLNNYWKFMKSVNSHSEIGWKLINGNEISRENNFTKGVDFYRFREEKYNDGLDEAYELMKVSDKIL